MTRATRDDLIDTYFEAMDTDDPELARPALADGFVYESLSGDLAGFAGLERYVTELRGLSNSTHEITNRVHASEAVAVEGVVTGETADGESSARFCDVFEFDGDDAGITRIAVYLNDA